MTEVMEIAAAIAEEVLFPRAMEVDASSSIPVENFDALAEAGLYGIFAPEEVGGLGADSGTLAAAVEVLAAGCLATTFVWIQHFGLVRNLLMAPAPLRDQWLGPACRGERRGGIAFGGLLPGPPRLRAEPEPDGWRLVGSAPWVTGWGRIDTLHVAARGPDETIVHLAIDAEEGRGLSVTRQHLVAVEASATVRAQFDGVWVPAERAMAVVPFDPAASGGTSLRANGSLALGVVRRCCQLMGPSSLDVELVACRAELDSAGDPTMALARARASELALRASAALLVQQGSRSIARHEHAQRLAREAMFLLVFGSRAEIKSGLLSRLLPDGQAVDR
jgi:alkylation response protein AidB-like acyl-CoA dehydrogenase